MEEQESYLRVRNCINNSHIKETAKLKKEILIFVTWLKIHRAKI